MYTAYDTELDNKAMIRILMNSGYKKTKIAEILGISRTSVYYFLDKEYTRPTRCMFTYGEYNLMLDFMDAWHELTQMDIL